MLFYKLYYALLEFTNIRVTHQPGVDFKQVYRIDKQVINRIREDLWSDKERLIDEFIKKNPFFFTKYELKLVNKFKEGFFKTFVILKFEREYTVFIDEKNAYYVKGLADNIDQVISYKNLPMPAQTVLIPFKDTIIYDGLLSTNEIEISIDMKENLENSLNSLHKVYKL